MQIKKLLAKQTNVNKKPFLQSYQIETQIKIQRKEYLTEREILEKFTALEEFIIQFPKLSDIIRAPTKQP